MNLFEEFQKGFQQEQETEMSLMDYLELCKTEPLAYATAAERAPAEFGALVAQILGSIAPSGNKSVNLTGGRNAVEAALFDAFIQRGSNSRFSVLGFTGSSHGNSLALAQFALPEELNSSSLGWPNIKYPESFKESAQTLT